MRANKTEFVQIYTILLCIFALVKYSFMGAI